MNKVISSSGISNYMVNLNNGSNTLIADEPLENGGGNSGFAPVDLLLSSLAACTSITLKMYADRKKWMLEKVETEMQSGSNENGFEISRSIKLIGNLDEEQKARLLQIANICPIHKILSGSIQIKTKLT